MLRVNLMVCRKCQQVFSLTAGVECPMCSSPLYMSVFIEETVHPTCATCGDSGRGAPTLSEPDGEDNACPDCGTSG